MRKKIEEVSAKLEDKMVQVHLAGAVIFAKFSNNSNETYFTLTLLGIRNEVAVKHVIGIFAKSCFEYDEELDIIIQSQL